MFLKIKSKLDYKNLEIILLILILLFAFFLRIYHLGNAPLWIDESISSMVSRNILEKGAPILDSDYLYSHALVFHYFQSIFLIWGQNDFNARIISVIFGLLTIVLAYLIGKEYSKTGGLFAALFMSTFYLAVFYSREARMYQFLQFMFFLSIYLLYKSKEKFNLIYPALISFIIAIDTQIESLVLAPFFIIHIWLYSNKKLNIITLLILAYKIIPALKLIRKPIAGVIKADNSLNRTLVQVIIKNTISNYIYHLLGSMHLFVLSLFGIFISYFKKKYLTTLLILPCIITLIGLLIMNVFALRYAYLILFPVVLYSGLLVSFLYEKYKYVIFIAVFALLLIPSNLFLENNYANIILPVDSNLFDTTAPYTNYKMVPAETIRLLKNTNNTLISYFDADVNWYIRKPDYVIPITMTGADQDEISVNNSKGIIVSRYSGGKILDATPKRPYYLNVDTFSRGKLDFEQVKILSNLIQDCKIIYNEFDLKIYYCN